MLDINSWVCTISYFGRPVPDHVGPPLFAQPLHAICYSKFSEICTKTLDNLPGYLLSSLGSFWFASAVVVSAE